VNPDLIRKDAAYLVAHDAGFADLDSRDLGIEVWGPGFGPLIHLILGQQVSIEAADAMYANLERASGSVTPDSILSLDDETMRRAWRRRNWTDIRWIDSAICRTPKWSSHSCPCGGSVDGLPSAICCFAWAGETCSPPGTWHYRSGTRSWRTPRTDRRSPNSVPPPNSGPRSEPPRRIWCGRVIWRGGGELVISP